MKKIVVSIFTLLLISITTNSCSNDDSSSSQRLTKDSPLTALLLRVTHNTSAASKLDGNEDDNEDGEDIPCFTINLPVTINTNGQSVTVSSQEEIESLKQCDLQFEGMKGREASIIVQGNYQTVLQILSNYNVTALQTRATDLEHLFMHYYEKREGVKHE